jgi:DNA-binding transcriptional ArsR family regulator
MAITQTLSISPRLDLFFALAVALDDEAGGPDGANRWLDQTRRRLDRNFRRRLGPDAQSAAFWIRLAALPLPRDAALSQDVEAVIGALAALPPKHFQPADDPEAQQVLIVDALRRFDRLAFAALWRPWREELIAEAPRLEARLHDVPVSGIEAGAAIYLPSRFAPPGFSAAVAEGDTLLLAFDPDRLPAPIASPLRAPRTQVPTSLDPALVFRALGDATRYTIARMIAREPMTSAELARRLDVSKPTMAYHLRALRAAALVREEVRGTRIVLSLDRSVLEGLSDAAVAQLFGGAAEAPIRRSRSRASAARGSRR